MNWQDVVWLVVQDAVTFGVMLTMIVSVLFSAYGWWRIFKTFNLFWIWGE